MSLPFTVSRKQIFLDFFDNKYKEMLQNENRVADLQGKRENATKKTHFRTTCKFSVTVAVVLGPLCDFLLNSGVQKRILNNFALFRYHSQLL